MSVLPALVNAVSWVLILFVPTLMGLCMAGMLMMVRMEKKDRKEWLHRRECEHEEADRALLESGF